jgi:methylphosphonate synthase
VDDRTYAKLVGARVRSELNDLKRDAQSAAHELGVDPNLVARAIDGDLPLAELYSVLDELERVYPIDASDLRLIRDDCAAGVRIMRASMSLASSRVFSRNDRSGARTPYYEYRDTAMSRTGPIKPEWIRPLRHVEDADPNNPDVQYNNGHFMHQLTFFIGPVNFYWEIEGERHCAVMNTGDSNYIAPFFPHSFASRDASQGALILAVTFGGEARRAQKEMYVLQDRVKEYLIDVDESRRGTTQLIRQHMRNACLSEGALRAVLGDSADLVLDEGSEKDLTLLQRVAHALGVGLADLLLPESCAPVVIRRYTPENGTLYPDPQCAQYRILPLAQTPRMPYMKGFALEVLGATPDLEDPLVSGLHSWVYNYGDTPVSFSWRPGGKALNSILAPGDSACIQPHVPHAFGIERAAIGKLCSIRVAGAMTAPTAIELSSFANITRVMKETRPWFT